MVFSLGRRWPTWLQRQRKIEKDEDLCGLSALFLLFSLVALVNLVRSLGFECGYCLFSFSRFVRCSWSTWSERYFHGSFKRGATLTLICTLGEPAQALPGFKGEIVSESIETLPLTNHFISLGFTWHSRCPWCYGNQRE